MYVLYQPQAVSESTGDPLSSIFSAMSFNRIEIFQRLLQEFYQMFCQYSSDDKFVARKDENVSFRRFILNGKDIFGIHDDAARQDQEHDLS